ncbi:hypothetical protein [Streptomyces sp. LBL]|uniref:hypothetical protein n=1 Tax=Streptomyces sp. LBL TaxID=2940562 RepID=UPI0024735D29|nr:hypothetical protein [Streptomyces sp. LBL]
MLVRSLVLEGNEGFKPLRHRTVAGPESEHGRGLLITDVLAARWGTQPSGSGLTGLTGQTVWAEILADAPGGGGAVR